jgi:endogenous inhibitor of DNA gyrase (YacG/DUF329 family)
MSGPPPEGASRRCAICGKPQDTQFKPFCSRRCANLDLSRWLGGRYVIPGRPADEGDQPAPLPDEADDSG